MEAAPDLYFETDHYKGWPAVLVRIHAIPMDELRLRLRRAYDVCAEDAGENAGGEGLTAFPRGQDDALTPCARYFCAKNAMRNVGSVR